MDKEDIFHIARTLLCTLVMMCAIFLLFHNGSKKSKQTPANTTTIVIGDQAAVNTGDTLILKIDGSNVSVNQ